MEPHHIRVSFAKWHINEASNLFLQSIRMTSSGGTICSTTHGQGREFLAHVFAIKWAP